MTEETDRAVVPVVIGLRAQVVGGGRGRVAGGASAPVVDGATGTRGAVEAGPGADGMTARQELGAPPTG